MLRSSYGCVCHVGFAGNGYSCRIKCRAGFEPSSDGNTCVDVNECLDPYVCNHSKLNAECLNQDGTFSCVCPNGFDDFGDACLETLTTTATQTTPTETTHGHNHDDNRYNVL